MKTAHDYMIALPAAERTENVKAMVAIILLDAEEEITQTKNDSYDEGFNDGQDAVE